MNPNRHETFSFFIDGMRRIESFSFNFIHLLLLKITGFFIKTDQSIKITS
jgi:hypothetical protein